MKQKYQEIAILDFGSQYTHLIARRFRNMGILAKLYPADTDLSKISNIVGIVLSGSPASISDNKYQVNENLFDLSIPILGLCYGHQFIADHFGGVVEAHKEQSEFGRAKLELVDSPLFKNIENNEEVWMSHGDSVIKVPAGFKVIGKTKSCDIAAMSSEEKNIYSLQFHPEVTHTKKGMEILENFAFEICQAKKDWNIEDWQVEMVKEIQDTVKDKKVFLLVSGGVDSTVSFALLEKALGKDRVFGLHIDNGLMRKNEVNEVQSSLRDAGFQNLEIYDASNEFLNALEGIYEPEAKRKIIGNLFLDIQDKVATKLKLNPDEWILGQGTIYPDTIETGGTKNAETIKTHHNRVPRVQELIEEGKIIEPIKDLYKDEVRSLGEYLGLPSKLVWRHPFPGPGLAIRALCLDKVNEDDLSNLTNNIKKSFPNLNLNVLPLKSVGVQGDSRTYAHPAVISKDMLEFNFKQFIDCIKEAPKLTNKFKEINRVILRVDSNEYLLNDAKLIKSDINKKD